MFKKFGFVQAMVFGSVLVGSLCGCSVIAQSAQSVAAPTPATATHTATASSPASNEFASSAGKSAVAPSSPYHPDRFAGRAGKYYQLIWGIDSLSAKYTESGEVIRFSYRVLNPEKAKVLNDKKNEPSLIDPKAGVKLVVPSLEKVGQLRQSSTPQAGKSYWMAFSNKGLLVKKGDHVDIVIGQFRAEGLVVD